MNKSNRISSILLGFCLVMLSLVVLIGCGGQATTQQSATPGSQPVQLTFWLSDFQNTTFAEVQAKFLEENPGVTINNVVMSVDDLYQRFLLAITADVGLPDVIALESSHVGQYVHVDALLDITDRAQPFVDRMVNFQWLDASKGGRIYAMPLDVGPVALYYRRDVFDRAGLPSRPEEVTRLLATWDDYYRVARIIKDRTGSNMFADSTEVSYMRNFEKLMFQRGVWYFDQNNNVTINNPQAREILDFMKKFYTEGMLENTVEWTQAWYDSFATGSAATHFGAVWMSGFLKGWIAPETEGLWGVVPLPVWEPGGFTTANDGGSTLAIPRGSRNQEMAWKLVEYLTTSTEHHMMYLKTTEQFPSLIDTFADPFFDQPDPFYAGQPALRVFANGMVNAPSVAYGRNYPLANEIMRTAFLRFMLGELTAQQALARAETEIKDRMTP